MSRALFEVAPIGNAWNVRMPGDSVSETLPTRADAIRRARELALQYSEWHVRVLSVSGAVEAEYGSPRATV